jgi:hypothetical protein
MTKENQPDDVERKEGKFDPVTDERDVQWQLLARLKYVPNVTR